MFRTSKYLFSKSWPRDPLTASLPHWLLLAVGYRRRRTLVGHGDNSQRLFQYQYVLDDALQNLESIESLVGAYCRHHVLELSKVVPDATAATLAVCRVECRAATGATDHGAIPPSVAWRFVTRAVARLFHGS